jgi:hypothetical protein
MRRIAWLAATSACSLLTSLDGLHGAVDSGSDVVVVKDAAGSEASYVATVLASQPIAYLRLGDTTTPQARDEVADASAYVGVVALGAAGAITNDPDTAVLFGGGHVDLGVDRFNFGTADFTIELWTKVPLGTDGAAKPSIFRVGQAGVNGFGVSYVASGIEFYGYGPTGRCTVDGAFVPSSKYVHVVAVQKSPTLFLYLNGVSAGQGACAIDFEDAGVPSMIGAAAGGFAFYGTVDEVSVYDRAMPPAEVTAHFSAGL